MAVAVVASREDGSCKRGGGERVGQGGLAVAGHDGLKDVNVASHIMIIHSTYS